MRGIVIKSENRVLITGATGFIGSNLLRRVIKKKSNSVFIITRKKSSFWRIKGIEKTI